MGFSDMVSYNYARVMITRSDNVGKVLGLLCHRDYGIGVWVLGTGSTGRVRRLF